MDVINGKQSYIEIRLNYSPSIDLFEINLQNNHTYKPFFYNAPNEGISPK